MYVHTQHTSIYIGPFIPVYKKVTILVVYIQYVCPALMMGSLLRDGISRSLQNSLGDRRRDYLQNTLSFKHTHNNIYIPRHGAAVCEASEYRVQKKKKKHRYTLNTNRGTASLHHYAMSMRCMNSLLRFTGTNNKL